MELIKQVEKFKINFSYQGFFEKIKQGNFPTQQLSLASQKLALLLYEESTLSYKEDPTLINNQLKDYITPDIWEKNKHFDLLVLFLGEEKANYFVYAWQQIPQRMYQDNYTRRSFRAPHMASVHKEKALVILKSVISYNYHYTNGNTTIEQVHNVTIQGDYSDLVSHENYLYCRLSLVDEIRYNNYFYSYSSSDYFLWAAAIDLGNKEVYQVLEDIIYNKDAVGKVTRDVIKALLNSSKKEAWELVEKLLLSAQRQEGLRQVILESLDETSLGALKHMLKVIIDHKLSRFSAVVRAADTWTGLGWETEKEKTVAEFLQRAYDYIMEPETTDKALKSANNMDVYMALWAKGVYDIEKTIPYLDDILTNGKEDKKALALLFAKEIQINDLEIPLYLKALQSDNEHLLAYCLVGIQNCIQVKNLNKGDYQPQIDALFKALCAVLERVKTKRKLFEGQLFSWTAIEYKRDTVFQILVHMMGDNADYYKIIMSYFDEMSSDVRANVSRTVLNDYYTYSFTYNSNEKSEHPPTPHQKEFALRTITDRSESVLASAVNTLAHTELSESEISLFHDLFKRKNSQLKKQLIKIILQQPNSAVDQVVSKLLSGDIEQRLSGLDLLLQLRNDERMMDSIQDHYTTFIARSKINPKESILLDQLNPANTAGILSEKNGYGIYNPDNTIPYGAPYVDKNSAYVKYTQAQPYGFSKPLAFIKEKLAELSALYLLNQDHEYETSNYDSSKEKTLLGNGFYSNLTWKQLEGLSDSEKYDSYPLPEVWINWFKESDLTPRDLFLLTLAKAPNGQEYFVENYLDYIKNYTFYYGDIIPNPSKNRWSNPLETILTILLYPFPFEDKNDFCINACSAIYSNLPDSVKAHQEENRSYNRENEPDINDWKALEDYHLYLNQVHILNLETQQLKRVWDLYRWRQHTGLEENAAYHKPPLALYCKLYQAELIAKDEMFEGILVPNRIAHITATSRSYYDQQGISLEQFPFLKDMMETIRENFLDVELKRGDSETSVTKYVSQFGKIYGTNRLVEIIQGLGKENLNKGYFWGSSAMTKKALFSMLLKRCFPRETETQADFDKQLKQADIAENRLIEAAVYAPQWQKFISSYLGWKGLDAAIWWMHAHTKTSDYQDQNSEAESEIAKYSAVDLQDFKDGAVDANWFKSAYQELKKSKWDLVYQSANYISDGNGHRRARLYADTLLGNLKIREVTAKVKEKRDQDYLRIYGLVPMSKTNPEKDVLSRYEYIQQFKKESKQFGSMRQTSEALAVRVALENLARNAGYADPIRLTWAMEIQQVQGILSNDTQVEIDDVRIELIIDDKGIADVVAFKNDKAMKAIPAKLKKDKKVAELLEHRKTLRDQNKRAKKGLEEAMLRGDAFTADELAHLFHHPVIVEHLRNLVFTTHAQSGFYADGALTDANGNVYAIKSDDKIRIAHCTDLHQQKVWVAYQRYCFDHQLTQPFKQIFRELYIPTADELAEKTISRRYAGHQVQPKQTLALLKTRGWKVDYEEGLQKVYHKEGFVVKLYAMADWFSPADVESPTLEVIKFHQLKGYSDMALEDIPPTIFSEVMRDIDLVVSVAHVGGVDPEASHSSIEMRAALLRETARLFKLTNVELIGSHAKIKGTLGDYSVHLGSAVVHLTPGKYLSILPVHSQHRGRLFLPFADDDPKSAEVISKVLLLAKDQEIQDPTILSQIQA